MQQIKLWEVQGNAVTPIQMSKLDFESRLESWLIQDISILSSNLAVIGSQVVTPYGKKIDILAINSVGEIIIIELKREKTYREVIAQVLDYATWVKELDYDTLSNIVTKFTKGNFTDIGDFFATTFKKYDEEEIEVNSDHKMLIVGSEIDDSTIRIINYLSNEPYSVNINAVNFNYFKDANGKEFLAQSFILPEQNIVEESRSKKRKRITTTKELFQQQKLKVGDRLYFRPALESGIPKTDPRIFADVVNTNRDCLRRGSDNEIYSPSNLRKLISQELSLNVKYDFGFGTRSDWVLDNGKSLADLLAE